MQSGFPKIRIHGEPHVPQDPLRRRLQGSLNGIGVGLPLSVLEASGRISLSNVLVAIEKRDAGTTSGKDA